MMKQYLKEFNFIQNEQNGRFKAMIHLAYLHVFLLPQIFPLCDTKNHKIKGLIFDNFLNRL